MLRKSLIILSSVIALTCAQSSFADSVPFTPLQGPVGTVFTSHSPSDEGPVGSVFPE